MRKFLIFIVIPCALLWWFWGRSLEPASVVHAHLEAISQHDYQKAYGYFSAAAQSRLSFDTFQEMVQKNPVVANNYTGEFLSRKLDHDVATFSGYVRTFNKDKAPATYTLVKEKDRWVIQDFRF